MKTKSLLSLLASLSLVTGLSAQSNDPASDAFQQAVELFQNGEIQEAIPVLEAIDLDAAPAEVSGLLGALYLEAARPSDALSLLAPLADAPDANAVVLYNAGRAAVGAGDTSAGLAYLQRSVALVPRSPAARELGILLAQGGFYQEAFLQLRPWTQQDLGDTEARIITAFCAVQLGRAADAEELLAGLPQTDPQVALLQGKLLLLGADPWAALSLLEPLLETAPDSMQLDISRALADAYAAIGQASESVKLLEGKVGDNASVALQLGQAQYQSGDLDGALATLEPFAGKVATAIQAGEKPAGVPPSLIIEYGRLLATSGQHAQALPFLQLATQIAPDNKQSWHQLGQALAAVGRPDEAQEALNRFQEIVQGEVPSSVRDLQLENSRSDPTGARLREAMQLVSEDRFVEALAIARQEAALAPDDLRPFLTEARILLLAERLDEALALADDLVEAASANADVLYIRGTIRMAMNRIDGAEDDLRAALERSPEHTAAMNDLAVLLMDRGDNAEARRLLERTLELRPNDVLAAENLRQLDG